MNVIHYGKCQKCGADLKETDFVGYTDGRFLCKKCRSSELVLDINAVNISGLDGSVRLSDLNAVNISGLDGSVRLSDPNAVVLGSTGLILDASMLVPSTSGTIGANISGLEKGTIDLDKIGTVDFRDEQLAKLKGKVEELENTGYEDKQELDNLKRRLAELEKKMPVTRNKNIVTPSFLSLCKILGLWFPRHIRRYEETYKAELTEYLSHKFLHVREEAEGGLCDILVAKKHPIHLKVKPKQSEYDILCGQILRTVSKFKHVACIIIGIPSSEHYNAFVDTMGKSKGTSKVRFFPKAR